MKLLHNLFDHFYERSCQVEVGLVSIGLGYTVVSTSDGGTGLSYTYFDRKTSCSMVADTTDFEGCNGSEMLKKVLSSDPIDRGMGLALVNALNHANTRMLPGDPGNEKLFAALGVGSGVRIGMVGSVTPLIRMMEEKGTVVEVIDDFKGIGDRRNFRTRLSRGVDGVLLTATSILNNSTEQLIAEMGSHVKVALLGPTTPMCLELFDHLPVYALAGIEVLDSEGIIRGVRHGAGTRYLHSFCRKTILVR